MSEKETPEFSPSQLWPPNLPDLIHLITVCGNTARKGVQNMRHWSRWTETMIENGVVQAGFCHHCGSHLSVVLSVDADHWSVFCTPLLQYFPHNVINWIQIWWIWRPQLRWAKFWSFFLWHAVVVTVWWTFQVSQGSVETLLSCSCFCCNGYLMILMDIMFYRRLFW